jgi:tetratricopeptide (TPR) repeat protein
MRLKALALCAVLAAGAAASPARAEGPADSAAAASLFGEARGLMADGRYAEACAKFAASHALLPSAGALLSLGDCYEKAGRTASAFGAFTEAGILASRRGESDRADEGRRRAELIAPRLSKLAVVVPAGIERAGLVIKQNGRDLAEAAWGSAVPVDPGEHTIDASSPGKQTWKKTVRVEGSAGTTTVEIPKLAEAPVLASGAPRGSTWGAQRIAGVAVGGAGVVGVVVGAVFGGITLKKSSDSKSGCAPDLSTCNAAGYALQHDAHTTARASNVGLILGGAALVGGLVLVLTAPAGGENKAESATRIKVGPSLGARGAGMLIEGVW